MAGSGYRRKRKRNIMEGKKKLIVGDKVEVRSVEDGFLGSWHAGEIISCEAQLREVQYDNLLIDDKSDFLTEFVKVSCVIDGNFGRPEALNGGRGRIRPLPPVKKLVQDMLQYGLCVDVYHNEAWWEVVVFDREEGPDGWRIFFPDLGDQLIVKIEDLWITQDWDEITGEWKARGKWFFLEIIEEHGMDNTIPVSIQQIWYDVRERTEFDQIGEWASPVKHLWRKLIVDIIKDNLWLSVDEFLNSRDFSEPILENGDTILAQDSTLTCEPNSSSSYAIVPPVQSGIQDGGLMTDKVDTMVVFDQGVENAQWTLGSLDASPSSSVAANSSDQLIAVESKALSIIHSELKRSTELSIYNGSEGLCPDSGMKTDESPLLREKSKSKKNSLRSQCKDWQPANAKLNLKPEFCPHSVDEYLLSRRKRPAPHLTNVVRNHLLYMGWKIEYADVKGIIRIRYTSPEGKKFQDLRLLCETCKKTLTGNPSQIAEHAQERISSSPDDLNLPQVATKRRLTCVNTVLIAAPKFSDLTPKPKYCPDAIFRYLRYSGNSRVTKSNKPHVELVVEARNHLKAIGWSFWFKPKYGRDEWRYDSPTTGKTYYSLRTVCQAIANGHELNNGGPTSSPMEGMISSEEPKDKSGGELSLCNTEAQEGSFPQTWPKRSSMLRNFRALGFRKDRKGKENGFVRPLTQLPEDGGPTNSAKNDGKQFPTGRLNTGFGFFSKKRNAFSKLSSSSDGNNVTRVLQSSKRIRQAGPSSSSQVPRTLLSWLIDNDVVLPRDKVQYRCKRSVKPMAEGRITREGIKCNCCLKVFTLTGFEAHAGSNCHRPAANIFLEDGRSLVKCQMDVLDRKFRSFSTEPTDKVGGNKCQSWNDHICSVCHYGGELILCDKRPSSFHTSCLNLQGISDGDWFCPSCCCGICGISQFDVNTGHFTDYSVLCCHQCERQFHAHCIRDREMVKMDIRPKENWFCSKTCERVHWGLQQLLGKPILVGHDNLTWTLIKPTQYYPSGDGSCDVVSMTENYSKLSVALEVMHECFEPVKEPQTKRDLVEDVIFCRGSHLNRLNFRGFYTVLLERNDELITVAALRVYGNKVAEIPLIGTRFQHRRLGMCRILMNEIEKNLMKLGVERLVLPAAGSVLNTWTTSFGFSPVTQSERSEFLGYTFLDFQDTLMCQKLLRKPPSPPSRMLADSHGIQHDHCQNIKGSNTLLDFEGNSAISEVFQVDRLEGSETVNQGAKSNGTEDSCNGVYNDPSCPVPVVTERTHQEHEPCGTFKPPDQKTVERDKWNGSLKFYKRKKAPEISSSIPQAKYPKVEVSCR